MKRVLTLAMAGALTVTLAAGQSAMAMSLPATADIKEEVKSPADRLQDVIDDLESSSIFINSSGYWAGNTYVNDAMGISMEIPDSFTKIEGQDSDEIKYLVVAMDDATQEALQLVEVNLEASGSEGMTDVWKIISRG